MLHLSTNSATPPDMIKQRASMVLSMAQVGVFDCQWDRPMLGTARLRSNNFFMSLTPPPRGAQIRFNGSDSGFAAVHGAFFIPAGTEITARSEGGPERLMLCRVSSKSFNQVLGEPIHWNESTRTAAMELRDTNIRSTLARMAKEVQNPGLASTILMDALCVSLIVELGRHLGSIQSSRHNETGKMAAWQLRRIEQYAHENVGHTPRLQEVASLCNISVRQLVRAFKASTGQTVQQYFTMRQIEVAKKLLTDSNHSIKAIALQLGFLQPASFATAFARACGEPPSAFRCRERAQRIV